MKSLDSAKATISSKRPPDLAPRHAENRAAEKHVLPAGQLEVETGPDFEERAERCRGCAHRPLVGSVIRARIFSSVLLPAPFGPMMPTISPFGTRKRYVVHCPMVSACRRSSKSRCPIALQSPGESASCRDDGVAKRRMVVLDPTKPELFAKVLDDDRGVSLHSGCTRPRREDKRERRMLSVAHVFCSISPKRTHTAESHVLLHRRYFRREGVTRQRRRT